ncbi:MAG: glycosyltransferase [Verrucomicrobia bacterium]|nr:glycosyltransferase [Verrucomicrobiota bacterium]
MFSLLIPLAPDRTAAAALASLTAAGLTEQDEVLLIGDGFEPSLEVPALPGPHRVLRSSGGGANAARNFGAAMATQPWLCFLDDDDVYLPGALTRLRAWIADHPRDRLVCLNARLKSGKRPPFQKNPLNWHDLKRRNLAGTASSMVIRKDLFDPMGGFDEEMVSMQDWEFWMRLSGIAPIPVLKPACVLYDDLGLNRISRNLDKRIRGFEQLIEKRSFMWDAKTLAFHHARLQFFRHLAGQAPRKSIWHKNAPLASLYYTLRAEIAPSVRR